MSRFVMRVLAPLRVRRAILGRLDGRYVTRADHRQDVRDSLWEVQALKREVTALRREVDQLRRRAAGPTAPSTDPKLAARVEDAHRLATETASAVDHVLQSEVLIWQAIDAIREAGGSEKAAP
ncbi:hypothetical protein AB0B89_04670 [Sphaerisporangium sp. NPDC049002]|uniref:hypothetical protein n=1 Tax=unclassified Sphaerisporangium TaxID=2630420 RepID=UPI0033FEB8B3